jgi:hypothetical protein
VYYTKGLWQAEDCVENMAAFFRLTSENKSHQFVVAMNVLSTASENGFEDFMLPEDMRCQFKLDYGVIHAEDVRRYLDAMSLDGPISPFNVMDYRIGRFLCHAAMMGDNHLANQLDDDNQLFD